MGKGNTILALDVSTTSTGFAIYKGSGKLLLSGCIADKSKDWLERVRIMARELNLQYQIYGIDTVVIEDTYVSKNVNTVKKLCMAQGIIIGMLPNVDIIQIYPTSWKSYYGLTKQKNKRSEQKQSSLSIAETMTRLSVGNDDEADAVLIGKYIVDNREKYFD